MNFEKAVLRKTFDELKNSYKTQVNRATFIIAIYFIF